MSIAIYPGSFDPVHLGHLDVIRRAAACFDKVWVCVMVNAEKKHTGLFTTEDKKKITVRRHPVILHSLWEAPDGRKALILLNYTRSEQVALYRGVEYRLAPHSAECVLLP